jgi:hypothetical protein
MLTMSDLAVFVGATEYLGMSEMIRDLNLRLPRASFDSLLRPMTTECEVGIKVSDSNNALKQLDDSEWDPNDPTADGTDDSGEVEGQNGGLLDRR